MELEEVLAWHGVDITIADGDGQHDVCGALVVIVVYARDLEWCAGGIWLRDVLVAVLIEVRM